jgi:hypothetical protein
VATSITIDGVSLNGLHVVSSDGQYTVTAMYDLLSGTQTLAPAVQDVTATLSASQLATVTSAFTAVQALLAAAPPGLPGAVGTPVPATATPLATATSAPPTATATPPATGTPAPPPSPTAMPTLAAPAHGAASATPKPRVAP